MSVTHSSETPATSPARTAPGIAAAEWRFVLIVIVALWALTSAPALYAYLSAPPDKQFMGVVLNVPDHAQYFMWFREHQSAFLINNKMTPEPNQPLFFNLLWFVLGNLGSLLGLGYPVMYQLMRAAGILFFLMLAYRICALVFVAPERRKAAFLIIALGSGFGWVLVLLKYTLLRGELINPLDLYVAEGNTFLSMMGFPHFLAAAVYIWCFELFLRAIDTGKRRYAVYAGLFAHFMGWQHAYDLLIVWGVLGATVLLIMLRDRALRWDLVINLALVGLLSFPPALYSALLTQLDPLWKEILKQFANAGVFTPPPYRLPVLLGFTFIFACIQTVLDARRIAGLSGARLSNSMLMIYGWFLVSFVLIYLPVDFQIHMLNGWQVPIGILAAKLLFEHVLPRVREHFGASSDTTDAARSQRLQRGLLALFVAAIIPTNLYLFAWRFYDLARHDYDYYLSTGEVAALRWLEANAEPDDVVLSSRIVGQYVPMMTGAQAYLAHWAQTADYFVKSDNVYRFYSSRAGQAERREIIDGFGVDYVLIGPAESRTPDFSDAPPPGAQLVFSSEQVHIYEVLNP